MQFVVFGIKNDGNHRQSATIVNSILCIRVTHALDIILFTFRYLLVSFFKMFKNNFTVLYIPFIYAFKLLSHKSCLRRTIGKHYAKPQIINL